MTAKIDIVNMALGHLAQSSEINDFDTDRTTAGQAARRYYDEARQKVLRDFDWPFANTVETLALVEEDPTVEWGFSYRYPENALAVRRILNGATRVDTESSRAQYSIGRDASGRIIYAEFPTSETAPLQIQYTYDEEDTERFTSDFVIALSFYLAFLMGPRVTQDTKFGLAAYQLYRQAISEAKANAANEEPRDRQPDAELIRERG